MESNIQIQRFNYLHSLGALDRVERNLELDNMFFALLSTYVERAEADVCLDLLDILQDRPELHEETQEWDAQVAAVSTIN
jgi:hypothetical protein